MSNIIVSLPDNTSNFPFKVLRADLTLAVHGLTNRPLSLAPGDYYVLCSSMRGEDYSTWIKVDASPSAHIVLHPGAVCSDSKVEGENETTAFLWMSSGQDSVAAPEQIEGGAANLLQAYTGNVFESEMESWQTPIASTPTANGFVVKADNYQILQIPRLTGPHLHLVICNGDPDGPDTVVHFRYNAHQELEAVVQLNNPLVNNAFLMRIIGMDLQAEQLATEIAIGGEQMLYFKQQDPLAAAAGAYLLLRYNQLERLHDWTERLANLFPSVPDGVVIAGEHLARLGQHEKALEYFLQLSARGLPFFSVGVPYIMSRLRTYQGLSTPPSYISSRLGEIDLLLANLERFSPWINFSEPFTQYPGLSPTMPGYPDQE